ncbi:serine protease, S1-C subfamily, contains C-terminal PDZ domain [Enhydrobacter aerosaccus]|uniref:Serine protease, S1-C subfamily, contains C-terminal PDZ domain n=1 Tax=Enhydrobacter aerosaccus TaxID=225324 RepID=A0A1T4JPU4_9HYPH|nr:S1C family serine protease [Enhydrobacter aerosaccus]SJZ32262.1 serine protease, S1-C subfamily, contains C-terminal PDZ domain [Enhydrobacter aerosaccus]
MARGLNGSANGSSHWFGGQGGVEARRPGSDSNLPDELLDALPAVVGLHSTIPEDRRTAQSLGSEREGHGVVIDNDGLVLTIGYLIMEADTVTIKDNDGHETPARVVGYDYESGFGLVRTETPLPVRPLVFGDSDSLLLRSEAYVVGVGGEKATLKVKVAGRREFAGYWEYLLDNAIFTVPAYPLWGGSALVGLDGTLLGIGSLLVQEALGPGSPAFPGNMYVPINRLKPIFGELVAKGRISTPPRPWLGIYTVEHMGQLVVGGISDGGPADRAGLKRGDVLQALDGEPLNDVADFYRRLWSSGPAGTAVTLRMERDSDAFEVTVRTGDRASYHKYGND